MYTYTPVVFPEEPQEYHLAMWSVGICLCIQRSKHAEQAYSVRLANVVIIEINSLLS